MQRLKCRNYRSRELSLREEFILVMFFGVYLVIFCCLFLKCKFAQRSLPGLALNLPLFPYCFQASPVRLARRCPCAREEGTWGFVCCALPFSHVWLFATLWTVARQAPPSVGFSRQEYWSGLPFPPLGHLPTHLQTHVSCVGRRILYHCAAWEARQVFYKKLK